MDSTRRDHETTRIPSATFEAVAVEMGLMTLAQVEECRVIHCTLLDLGLTSTVAEVCVKKGVLTASQVASVETALGRRGEVVFPGYQILGRIAEGGMGVVYKARQVSMNRLVALKVLLPQFAIDEAGRERFIREAHAVAKLSHPNIVAGIDAGEVSGVYYFVMEYLDGEPMDQALRQRGPLPWREAAAIVRQVALALEHADRHGLMHRDVKPGNIMLLADGVVKLADLGLARATTAGDAALTQAGMIVGSPAYLSPEQARSETTLDIRSDIFSLGLCLFEFVSGRRAYAGSNPMSVLTELLTRDVSISSLEGVALPPGLTAVLTKMTQRDVEQRYASPRQVSEDLEAVLDDRPPRHALAGSPADAGASQGNRPSGSGASPPLSGSKLSLATRVGSAAVLSLLVLVSVLWWVGVIGGKPSPPEPAVSAVVPASTSFPAASPPPASTLLDLTTAVARANPRVPGGVVFHAELELGRYSIDFAVDKHTYNVVIDATDGRVIEELREDDDYSMHVQMAKLTLVEAVRLAEKAVGGTATEAEILLLPGRAVIDVKQFRDGKAVWVDVDGVTGAVSPERTRALQSN